MLLVSQNENVLVLKLFFLLLNLLATSSGFAICQTRVSTTSANEVNKDYQFRSSNSASSAIFPNSQKTFEQANQSSALKGEISTFRIKREEKNYAQGSEAATLDKSSLPSFIQSNDYVLNLNASKTSPIKSSFIWAQSADGGYYDASGQTKELVSGDMLYKYGGKFTDGVSVPDFPCVTNFHKHVYRPFVHKRVGN